MKEYTLGELAKGLREGNKRILEAWYKDYVKIIFSVANAILNDHGLAEDVCGQLLYELIAGEIQSDAEKSKAYLAVAAKNCALNLRKKNKWELGYDDVKSESAFGTAASVYDHLLFYDSLRNLNEEEQGIVVKRVLCGYKLKEIAKLDGTEYGQLRGIYRKVRAKLKVELRYE
ncbi:MAG: sigma-70 family RNA polymerase sigma factor [Clostridia bacterium]|nr:sigma-70 family RNA polymerase sigma factor [Clostridia bacterium]